MWVLDFKSILCYKLQLGSLHNTIIIIVKKCIIRHKLEFLHDLVVFICSDFSMYTAKLVKNPQVKLASMNKKGKAKVIGVHY